MKGSLISFMDRTVRFLPEGRGVHHHKHLPMVTHDGCPSSSSSSPSSSSTTTHSIVRFLFLSSLLLLLASSTCLSQDVPQHEDQQRHLLQQQHHHHHHNNNNHQQQRTDYADATSAAFMAINQTSSGMSGMSKYPLPLKEAVKPHNKKNKRKRGRTALEEEEEYGGSYRPPSVSPMASAASRALFLQAASKESRDQMLKSSKDALIVTKKSYLKKDWCKTEPLIQRVREAGCFTRTVVNRFCYGQCNSFYIPKNAKRDIEDTSFKSCSFCKPKRFRWITITLHCPGRNPPYKKKRIQRIKKCKCISEILQ